MRDDDRLRILLAVDGVDPPTVGLQPPFGAARLARLATTGEAPEDVCTAPSVLETVEPDPQLAELYSPRIELFRSLYRALKPEFARS
jgi:xylulokinase